MERTLLFSLQTCNEKLISVGILSVYKYNFDLPDVFQIPDYWKRKWAST